MYNATNNLLGRGRGGNLGFPAKTVIRPLPIRFVDSAPVEEKQEEKKFQSPIEKRKRQQEKSGTKYI